METKYNFMTQIVKILNAGESRALTLSGNIFDLFYCDLRKDYLPLVDFLLSRWSKPELKNYIKVIYELNGPISFLSDEDKREMKDAWYKLHAGGPEEEIAIKKIISPLSVRKYEQLEDSFDKMLSQSMANPTLALEFLRQLCLISRTKDENEEFLLKKNLIILVEAADMLIPEGEISRISEADRKRIAIVRDWVCDPGFMNAQDSVIFITESKSKLSHEISRLPQLLDVEVSSPDEETRKGFISWFSSQQPKNQKPKFWKGGSQEELASLTAGLSIQAIMQLLKSKAYFGEVIQPKDVVSKVEEFIEGQLGEGVVEFHKPAHRLKEVIGNKNLKKFLVENFIPRLKKRGKGAISGAAIAGPNRVGKSFIFEAVAAEIGMVVLVLKNLRSKWFGETDVIFERLRRLLVALDKVLIFVDEADTQFGNIGSDAHPTERRLTGNIQNMMADPRLRGKVVWLLLTARIHLLSPDIRQPGRAGDMMIPVLDPKGEDLDEFVSWVVKAANKNPNQRLLGLVKDFTKDHYSAGAFDFLRRELIAARDEKGKELSEEEILDIVKELIPPEFSVERRIQSLHALLNCTRRSLLSEDTGSDINAARKKWKEELEKLERF